MRRHPDSPPFPWKGHRPELVFLVGLILFWLTCWYGERLPDATLFIGPGLMLAGIMMGVRIRDTRPF